MAALSATVLLAIFVVSAAGCARPIEEIPVPDGASVQQYRGLTAVSEAVPGERPEYLVSVYRAVDGEFLLSGTAYDDPEVGAATLLHGPTDSDIWQIDLDLVADYAEDNRTFDRGRFYEWVSERNVQEHDGPVGGP